MSETSRRVPVRLTIGKTLIDQHIGTLILPGGISQDDIVEAACGLLEDFAARMRQMNKEREEHDG